MTEVVVENLKKNFGELVVINNISFTVPSGSVMTLLGPSGCGKTTTLRCIAGLEWANSGRIRLGEDTVFDGAADIAVPAEKREIGMVFQSYAIWPHLTVFDNIAFPLKLRRASKPQIRTAVMEALASVGLQDHANRYPSQLSGGQQQRAVLARCLVYKPRVLLLDEPLANLDASLREEMRFELREVQQRFGLTSIYVTHDQAEAMALSDTILVLKGGNVVSAGSPREVFEHPKHHFVAGFLGGANMLSAVVAERGTDGTSVLGVEADGRLVLRADAAPGSSVTVAARPMDLSLHLPSSPAEGSFEATLKRVTYLGEAMDCVVFVAGQEIRVKAEPDANWKAGDVVRVRLHPTRVNILEAENA
ncbi:MAG: ABC transporter ATP-binding protein [Shinella sp.]|uniref:ABC transporter ATP-binding protein n=1 Tax=Shinella sp. TaxID=1870904 RepID=UPI003C745FC3